MKLLLSKPDSLGDQFIAAGVVQAFHRLQPGCRIVWHVRAGMEVIAPLIGAEVFAVRTELPPEEEAARLMAQNAPLIVLPYALSSYEPWTEDVRIRVTWWVNFLRATTWDVMILGMVNRTWVGDLTAAVAPAPVRIGFDANAACQPLVNEAGAFAGPNAPSFTVALPPSFTRSEATQLLSLFAALDARLRTLERAPVWQPIAGWHPPPAANVRPRVVIAPGVGGDPRRAWGIGNFLRVAETLAARGAAITWLEGPGDAAYLNGLPADANFQHVRFGAADLPQLVGALMQCDLLLCHDTAYVHIAAGLGVMTVAIYGAGQSSRFHPTGGKIKIVQSQIACAGCQWHCLWDRLVCVADIPVEAVTAAIDQLLAGNAAPTHVALPTPVAHDADGELSAIRTRLQDEVLALNADRFARLQIIHSLLAKQAASRP